MKGASKPAVPFHASRTGSKGRWKSSCNETTKKSPPTLLGLDDESRAVIVKLARVPAVIIDRATPETTVVDEHVSLTKTDVWVNAREASPNNTRQTYTEATGRQSMRLISGTVE